MKTPKTKPVVIPSPLSRLLVLPVRWLTAWAVFYAGQLSTGLAQGTAFTYQGRLDSSGTPYTGNAEFLPTLWNAASGGSKVADNSPAQIVVGVTNGLFTLPLNFGANFPGADRWLQLEVRTTIGPFTMLSPRQQLTPTPYALTASNLTGMLPVSQLSGTLPSANLGGTYSGAVTFTNAANSFRGTFTGNGAGLTSLNASQLSSGTVPDGRLGANVARTNQVWLLGGNAGTTPGVNFLGTTDNQPLELRVNRLRGLRLEDNGDGSDGGTTPDGAPNVIGGAPNNWVASGVVGATISGGGAANWSGSPRPNSVSADYATIGVGRQNTIQTKALYATIGGGLENSIETNATYATIGGGRNNTIQTNSLCSTISGGSANTIEPDAYCSTIGGGDYNTIQRHSLYAIIPGGYWNSATNYAFAAGCRAKANHTGAFVWGDRNDDDIASTTPNSVTMRASGGYRLFSNARATTGVSLAPGGRFLDQHERPQRQGRFSAGGCAGSVEQGGDPAGDDLEIHEPGRLDSAHGADGPGFLRGLWRGRERHRHHERGRRRGNPGGHPGAEPKAGSRKRPVEGPAGATGTTGQGAAQVGGGSDENTATHPKLDTPNQPAGGARRFRVRWPAPRDTVLAGQAPWSVEAKRRRRYRSAGARQGPAAWAAALSSVLGPLSSGFGSIRHPLVDGGRGRGQEHRWGVCRQRHHRPAGCRGDERRQLQAPWRILGHHRRRANARGAAAEHYAHSDQHGGGLLAIAFNRIHVVSEH